MEREREMFLYKYGPIKQRSVVLLKLLRCPGRANRAANTVNILMPLPIRRKLVTSQSILKIKEGAGRKKREREGRKKACRGHGFLHIWLCQEKLSPAGVPQCKAHHST